MTRAISLTDKYALDRGRVYLTGIQTLLRIAIDQRAHDEAAKLHTAGFISGYRGSPLGGVDQEYARNAQRLEALDIHFRAGVNEELGATAVWGTQKVALHGKGSTHDGVFGMWYGKAPGVDRAGDALRQANASGTAKHGGVLALCGDDHLAKSSILPAQSEFALQHFEMPFFNPCDLQDVLDYGLHGLALSRYAGLWSGLICLADTMDASGLVDVDRDRLTFTQPANADPRREHDVNRALLLGNRLETERLLRDVRLPAVASYARANELDRLAFGSERARIGFVATGKAYRDLRQAFALLGIDEARAKALSIAIYKVAMPWPMERTGLSRFARGKDAVIVVEHKRAFMEPQIKDALYALPDGQRPRIWGKLRPDGQAFLPDVLELRAEDLVEAILAVVPGAAEDEAMRAVAARMLERNAWAAGHAEGAQRSAYFCSGCPHSTSTKVPEGARAMPGIGCHAMTEINGRTTDGQIAMGGEGVPWVGQQPFSKDGHVFVNMGDGTYYHSGLLAIRQAVAARVPITYKILFNDAVAMTGGQAVDGPLSVPALTRQLQAEGVERIAVLSERPELYEGRRDLAEGIEVEHRDALPQVQDELARYRGVSAIVYDQTCAAEKRRRRKKAGYEDPPRRLFINQRVCEGCGDCQTQSNCISLEPLATPFGEKRTINQSTCNKDFSCVKGFCPSFAWVEGGEPKRAADATLDLDALAAGLPSPRLPAIDHTYNLLLTGIGGFGVTTTAAVLAMAAHIDGLNASTLDMTGLAQKNGPVTSHVRFAAADAAIEGPRVPVGSLDALLAADMLVACSADVLAMTASDRTLAIVNTKVQPTAEFVMRGTLSFDEARMSRSLNDATRRFLPFDAAHVAEKLFGDGIYANTLLLGAAYQEGALPLTEEAILQAIALNGAAVDANHAAFRAGRILAADASVIAHAIGARSKTPKRTLDEEVEFFATELAAYQNEAYAARYRTAIAALREADARSGEGGMRLTELAAKSLYKAMAYKDEYEVARLYSDPAYRKDLAEAFDDPKAVRLMLAPPILSRTDPATGRPKKRAFGPWIFPVLSVLAKFRWLRGSVADPFARSAERKAERALVEMVFGDLERIASRVGSAPYGLLCEIARVASTVKGFGPVKHANYETAMERRRALLYRLDATAIRSPQHPIARAPAPLPIAAE